MPSSFELETSLILACARTDPDMVHIQALVERSPDWQAIVRRSEQWGIAPLVYTSLRPLTISDQVPVPVTEQLRHLFRRETIHSVGQREMLRISLLRFVEASIPVIVLHAVALATLVYPSPNLRPIIDIDLLVHTRDQAESILAGVQTDYPSAPYLGPWGIHQIKLHEHLSTGHGSVRSRDTDTFLPTEDVWQRAQPAEVETVNTLVLSREDLLLQLALQLWALDGIDSHVKTLCDIGETCRRYGNVIDWSRLVIQAERYGMAKQLSYALHLARDLVGVDVPIPTLVALQASFDQLLFEDRFIAAIAHDTLLADKQADRFTSTTKPSVNAVPSEAQPTNAPQQVEQHIAMEVTQSENITHSPGELAVTYDQHGASDGVGAQVQRIYGLYALARSLGIKYVHTPLERVEYQGFIALLNRSLDPNFVERYNTFFTLPSDDFDLEGCERIKIHNLNLATVERYRAQAVATGRSILLQTLLPFAYTDVYPAAYKTLHEVSPYRDYQPSGAISVCIHMRRGDNLPDSRRRWLPNSYYLRVCEQILKVLDEQGVPYTMRLHSEMPTRRYALYPLSPGLYFDPEQPVTIDPVDYALEDFDALPNLEMVFNAEPLDALRDFATADVLILSASSFGYLGGMLNPHGVVVFAPFTWNAALPDWLVADQDGNLNPDEVTSKITDMLQCRGG